MFTEHKLTIVSVQFNNGSENMDIKELFLQENVGGFDLMFRAFFGSIAITVLAMDLVDPGIWSWVLAIIAFAGLYTSITRHCTPYYLIGFSTAKK